jgi:four helix bundle protein
MSGGGPERLLVYRRAALLADEVHAAVRSWQSLDRWSTGIQLVRAADSVCANIAEGTGRWTLKDQLRFFLTARGSLYEAQEWLARASARDLRIPNDARTRADEIGRMLNGLITSTVQRTRASS